MQEIQIVVPARDGAEQLAQVLPALITQRLPEGWRSLISVVDDGSTDDTTSVVRRHMGAGVALLVNASPTGRARARNRGAAVSDSKLLAFIDVDCLPSDDRWLERHLLALEAGADVTGGPIEPSGSGFWTAYMTRVAARRDTAARSGDPQSLTSANFAMRRECWDSLGGFDEGYLRYGFEDRDLIARAAAAGLRIDYLPEAVVTTSPPRNLAELVDKNEVAGRWSAPLFRAEHPAIYRRTPFWIFDGRVGPFARFHVAGPLGSLARPVARLAERLATMGWLPWWLRRGIVRLALGMAFLRGTVLSAD